MNALERDLRERLRRIYVDGWAYWEPAENDPSEEVRTQLARTLQAIAKKRH